MRIAFAGTPAPAVPSLRALLDSPHEVVAVITRPDAPAGRGKTLRRSPIGQVADAAGIPVLQPAKAGEPEFLDRLRELHLDVCAVVAYGAILPQRTLDLPRLGWVNLHFSLLPRWRGAAPVQHAIRAGDQETGVTTFRLEAGMDTGPVFHSARTPIRPHDTSGTLLDRLAQTGAEVLRRTFADLADGSARPTPQTDDGMTLAPKVSVEDAHVDFRATTAEVDRLVRSCTPAPGAWTTLGGVRIKLGPVRAYDDGAGVGRLTVTKRQVIVGTADGAVELGEVQPPGKRAMPAADFARGARLRDGDLIGVEA